MPLTFPRPTHGSTIPTVRIRVSERQLCDVRDDIRQFQRGRAPSGIHGWSTRLSIPLKNSNELPWLNEPWMSTARLTSTLV